MAVFNDLDRFHLVMDTINRLPKTDDLGVTLQQQLKDKLIEHKRYITRMARTCRKLTTMIWIHPK
ncbi:MAG: xylulose 5-phosphate/fructose 6-phosphate phosphoketolase [Desulfuromonadales bacterium]